MTHSIRIMAITNKQHEPAISDQTLEPAKPHDPVLDEIKAFHETLESERVHRVLVKWRKRKHAEELSNGTSILEKILRTLHDELESRKARAELWDRALVAELQPDRARQELDEHATAFGLSLEKKTQFCARCCLGAEHRGVRRGGGEDAVKDDCFHSSGRGAAQLSADTTR